MSTPQEQISIQNPILLDSAILYVVATPIGNLSDITLRALEILKSVDVIICEDTRLTKNLLNHYQINKPLMSFHQHSKGNKFLEIANLFINGQKAALVTDAGTPNISDPGGLLIEFLLNKKIDNFKIIPIPGPSAIITALSVSGFPADNFIFLGFPPHKKGRQTFFKKIEELEYTIVFYESKHRIEKTLNSLIEVLGDRQMMVARELTKQFETIYRGTPAECLTQLKNDKILGEFVVVVRAK